MDFVVGVRQDTLYFITATNGRVRRQDERTSVVLLGNDQNSCASGNTIRESTIEGTPALYFTTHHRAAKAVGKEYYDEREPVENPGI